MNAKVLRFALLLLLVLPFAGCSDDDDPAGPAAPADFDITGTWSVSETVDATACGEGTQTDTWSMTATQTGNALTVTTPVGTFTGTVSGSDVNWSGSFPEDGGTTTISLSATLSGGDDFAGTSTWSWTDGIDSCGGTSVFTGTRTS